MKGQGLKNVGVKKWELRETRQIARTVIFQPTNFFTQ